MPRVDPIHASVSVVSSEGLPVAGATVTAIADNDTTKCAVTLTDGVARIQSPLSIIGGPP